MRRYLFPFLVGAFLYLIALVRTDGFSPSIIQAPLSENRASLCEGGIRKVFLQPFRYLSKGRQCFVFESEDGKYVLKFFNQKYLTMPWYSFLWEEKERAKRSLRRHFYENSYQIAFQELGEEILYLHLSSSNDLPEVTLVDRAKRDFQIDLNQVPFVLQKKGAPIYSALDTIYQEEGIGGIYKEIDHFVAAISHRIEKNIADGDSDVEHNWGYVDGKLFHLDPGRLYYEKELQNPERLQREWDNATRGFHKWLRKKYPEAALYLQQKTLK